MFSDYEANVLPTRPRAYIRLMSFTDQVKYRSLTLKLADVTKI